MASMNLGNCSLLRARLNIFSYVMIHVNDWTSTEAAVKVGDDQGNRSWEGSEVLVGTISIRRRKYTRQVHITMARALAKLASCRPD